MASDQLCYNRGCGQRFNPEDNKDDSCLHHPGAPFFHDAYKGWSCCKKKCTDFTEFLNIKGCFRSAHNNVKPAQPEKVEVDKTLADEVIEYKAPQPLKPSLLERPPIDSPLVKLKYSVSPSLQQELNKLSNKSEENSISHSYNMPNEVAVGTSCTNGGCKETYLNESLNESVCTYHPGVPIFHEGLKYWTCCTRRTTDFQTFLNQEGCNTGSHVWRKKEPQSSAIKCRQDWMQTGSHVIVNIYCKTPDPTNETKTFIEVNPIRLAVQIFFPSSGNSYKSDIELRGIIDTLNSSVTYSPSKVEIKLKKAEPMSWNRLDVPRPILTASASKLEKDENLPKVDVLDLSDL